MSTCSTCGKVLTPIGEKGDTGHTNSTVPVTVLTTATYAPTVADSGTTMYFDRTGGTTVTLPENPNVGTTYDIVVRTENSAGNNIIETSGSDVLLGYVNGKVSGSADEIFKPNAALSDTTITLNGSTTGGDIGTNIKVTYADATNHIWMVEGQIVGTAVLATPFS
jgi:hypothetical protein